MRKNAFTLIELLAVITILAFISLIAVPIVINIINDSKEESLKKSIRFYVDTVEKNISRQQMNDPDYEPDKCIVQENGNVICSQNGEVLKVTETSNELKIAMKGGKPSSGNIYIENGKILYGFGICISDKYYTYNSLANSVEKGIPTEPGLYDKNYNLLASWNELETTYRFNIELQEDSTLRMYLDTADTFSNLISSNNNLSPGTILVIKNGIHKIESAMFYENSSLTDVYIPNSVTSIEEYAFDGCTNLKNIVFESSDVSISPYAFSDLDSINVTWLDSKKTSNNSKKCNAVIPSGTKTINSTTFSGCNNLTSVTIPSSVTYIGWRAFYGLKNLKTIIFEENSQLRQIDTAAFYGSGIESITIPKSVTYIGDAAFANCKNLSSIKVESGNSVYEDRNSNAIIEKDTNTLIAGLKSTIIPTSVTSIGDSAFSGCSGLTSITIPNSVTSIGDSVFSGCSGLTSITIPNSVTSIGDSVFANCKNLKTINVGVGNTVYEDRNSNAIIEKDTNTLIVGSKNTIIPNTVTTIAEDAFKGNGIESITIPNSVEEIEYSAFEDCKNLKSVIFENNSQLTNMQYGVFKGSGIENIIIPKSVEEIEDGAFENCKNLKTISVEAGNTVYEDRGSNAVIEKSTNTIIVGSKSTVIPNTVTTIGYAAFKGNGIENITFPSNLKTIEEEAFLGCENLKSIKLSDKNIKIEYLAFYKCKNLEKVSYTNLNEPSNSLSHNSGYWAIGDDNNNFQYFINTRDEHELAMYLRWKYTINDLLYIGNS